MKYYRLTNGTSWNYISLNNIDLNDYRQIDLYDDNLDFYGIGLYLKLS